MLLQKFKRLLAVLLLISATFTVAKPCSAISSREQVAKIIAQICIEYWDKYGIWPSVAIGQAFVESGLGVGPNLFGVLGQSGRSIEDSTIGYLEVLQNQYFKGEADFAKSPEAQLAIIMKGGRYCEGQYPYGAYYNNVISSIDKYGWRSYDKSLQKIVKEKAARKRRKKLQYRPFNVEFSAEVPEGSAITDPEYIPEGSIITYPGGLVQVSSTRRGLKDTVIVGLPAICKLDRSHNESDNVVAALLHHPVSISIHVHEKNN